jgi:cholesterol transport system auxiliary component
MMRTLAAAALVVAIAAGCTLLPPEQTETNKEVLSTLPEAVPQRDTRPATLLVLRPDTQSIYDTTQMAYMTRPYQVDYFMHYAWGATPSQMLLPLLVKTLENTHAFAAILTTPYAGHYSYALRTEILELTQDFTTHPPILRLALRMQLGDATGRIIATKSISLREPLEQESPYAGVVAANNAAAKALLEVAKFALENTE